MDVECEQPEGQKKTDLLVRLAGDALPLTEGRDSRREGDENADKTLHGRPTRPTVIIEHVSMQPKPDQTSTSPPSRAARSPHRQDRSHPYAWECRHSRATTDGSARQTRRPSHRSSFSRSASGSPGGTGRTDPISHMLRRNTVSALEPSAAQTLPPLQRHTSLADPTKPASGTESIPSLAQYNLKDLLNSTVPVREPFQDLGRSPQLPVTLHSPPLGSRAHPGPRSRVNSTFSTGFSHGQPSPVPSDASPRGSVTMSPPDKPKPIFPPYQFGKPTTTQSEELTPQSAQSHPSSTSYSTAPSPQFGAGEQFEIDRNGRVLPPLVPHPGPPLMTGAFKCTYSGCTAAPFQTQYLLK